MTGIQILEACQSHFARGA